MDEKLCNDCLLPITEGGWQSPLSLQWYHDGCPKPKADRMVEETTVPDLTDELARMMEDAPFCPSCGKIMVRNGACYKCLNCGTKIPAEWAQ